VPAHVFVSPLCIFMCLAVLGLMFPCIQSISLCVYLLKYWSMLSACLFTIYFPSMIYSKNSFLSDMHIYISMNSSLVHSPSCHFFILLFIYLSVHPSSIHGRDSGTASSTKRISCVPSVTQLLGWPRLDAATKVEIVTVNIYDTVNGKIKNWDFG